LSRDPSRLNQEIVMTYITQFVRAFGRSVDQIVQAYLASLLGVSR
jgi:hypothetical protein